MRMLVIYEKGAWPLLLLKTHTPLCRSYIVARGNYIQIQSSLLLLFTSMEWMGIELKRKEKRSPFFRKRKKINTWTNSGNIVNVHSFSSEITKSDWKIIGSDHLIEQWNTRVTITDWRFFLFFIFFICRYSLLIHEWHKRTLRQSLQSKQLAGTAMLMCAGWRHMKDDRNTE